MGRADEMTAELSKVVLRASEIEDQARRNGFLGSIAQDLINRGWSQRNALAVQDGARWVLSHSHLKPEDFR